LKEGDIVQVHKRGKFITYLEVAEASGAISKLVAVKAKEKYATKVSFNEIKLGSSVKKVNQADEVIFEDKMVQEETGFNRDERQNNKKILKEDMEGRNIPSSNLLIESLAVKKKEEQKKQEDQDVQIKKLSENYVVLSNNLAELVEEKKAVEFKYAQLEKEVENLRKNLRKAEIQNSMLGEENKELKLSLQELQEDESEKKVKELKRTISILKKKLENMAQIIEGNLK